jgi:hypothetical protein
MHPEGATMNIQRGWAVLAAISVIQLASNSAARADAAIAIGDWGVAGAGTGQTRQHAARLAVENCRGRGGIHCQAVATVEDGCIAVAVSSVPVCLPPIGVGTSWSREMARREARRRCARGYDGYRCRIDVCVCGPIEVEERSDPVRPPPCEREVREGRTASCPPSVTAPAEEVPSGRTQSRPVETAIKDDRTKTALYNCQQKATTRELGELVCGDDPARDLFVAMSYENIAADISTTSDGTRITRKSPSGLVTCTRTLEQYTGNIRTSVDKYECRLQRKFSEW